MTEEQLAELERLARAATPGEWRAAPERMAIPVLRPDGMMIADCAIFSLLAGAPTDEENRANAAFIAAAHPGTMLALIAAVRAERARAERAEAVCKAASRMETVFAECNAAAAQGLSREEAAMWGAREVEADRLYREALNAWIATWKPLAQRATREPGA